jgi:hypothetical protein
MRKCISENLKGVARDLLGKVDESEKEAANKVLKTFDDDNKAFKKMPNEKPPRRQKGVPLSETKDYGREYMAGYRADGKDSTYIPKGKKK